MRIAKPILLLCSTAFFIQTISCQYIGAGPYSPLGAGTYGSHNSGYYSRFDAPYPSCNGIASTAGNFPVRSVSPIAPTGLTVVSENVIEGKLGAGGQLPFLGTVALEGAFPTAGVGAISYACGNGAVGITSESPFVTGILNQPFGPVSPLGPLNSPIGPLGYGTLGCNVL